MWYDATKTPMYMTIGIKNELDLGDKEFSKHLYGAIEKYFQQDWGDTDEDDWGMNDNAVVNGDDRIVAVYKHLAYEDIFIITEHDRSVTTILFADEY